MSGTKIAYEMNVIDSKQSILAIECVFKTIQSYLGAMKPLLESVDEIRVCSPQFEEDLKNIIIAYDHCNKLVSKKRISLLEMIKSGELAEKHLKKARYDLRAKAGVMIVCGELIKEQFVGQSEKYTQTLNSIIAFAKNLITAMDGLLVESIFLSDDYSTNQTGYVVPGVAESSMPYGEPNADCTVLIINNSIYNREILRRQLSGYGVNVLTAVDSTKGLEIVLRQPVDLVLLDVTMPLMDGYEVLTRFKWEATHRMQNSMETFDFPIIALTAQVLSRDRKTTKPIELDRLLSKMTKFMINDNEAIRK